ncbi:hypothetical protein [Aureispira anguillae]|uniref:HNH endonuclease n=1 Tax=Aureispira anguillae TaxID=2864201 RepID=A0A916DY57_9BACT|nr:hypothetical protein [Aureispira anguillae]BDS15686.1 hypothetical protein AsAng_0064700 [Aureispira anguillae]
MGKNRDNFTQKTKRILAQRVAYRCSFPGCRKNTVGAGHKNPEHVVLLGDAAHISAAAKNGPRYSPNMTIEERRSINNGIWLCKIHAALIDKDYTQYSIDTIKQWKVLAEQETQEELKIFNSPIVQPKTLVALGTNIVFEGTWETVTQKTWSFLVHSFVKGDETILRDFIALDSNTPNHFIVVETQGDGRVIVGECSLVRKENLYEFQANIASKTERTTPYHLSGLPVNFTLKNGSIKLEKGVGYVKKVMEDVLGTKVGETFFNANFGSFLSQYFQDYGTDKYFFERMVKVELTRLLSIPFSDGVQKNPKPLFHYINRILSIEVLELNTKTNKLPIKLELEWGDGKRWKDILYIYMENR